MQPPVQLVNLQHLRCYAAASNQMALIKELRERTGAPISDVKNALQAAEWNLGECHALQTALAG